MLTNVGIFQFMGNSIGDFFKAVLILCIIFLWDNYSFLVEFIVVYYFYI